MDHYKRVSIPIKVPDDGFCHGHHSTCEHFIFPNDKNTIPTCKMGFRIISKDLEGRVLKPKKCRDLKEVT